MAFIFTPGQFRDRANFYQQVASLVSAGFGLPNALEELRDNPPARGFRQPLDQVLFHLRDGATFAEALRQTGTWISEFDVALLEAGEKSGRLDSCLKLLASYYEERTRLARTVLGEMAYPAFLLHAALFILGVPELFSTGDLLRYATVTLGVLIPLYVLVLIGVFAFQGSRGPGFRLALETVVGTVPLLGRARRHLALARLAIALESLLNAGVNVINAWELAARAGGSSILEREIETWRPQIESGVRPSQLMKDNRHFPTVFANLYATGEVSGRLDDHLGRIHKYYQESGTGILRQLAAWTPRIVYLMIAGFIAYRIISFYAGYYQTVGQAIDF